MAKHTSKFEQTTVKHVSYRTTPERLSTMRQAALDRDISLNRLIDEALDHFLDADRRSGGQTTADAILLGRLDSWVRDADEHDRRRLVMFLGLDQ